MPEVMDVTGASDETGHETTLLADASNVTTAGESTTVDNLRKDLMHMATLDQRGDNAIRRYLAG